MNKIFALLILILTFSAYCEKAAEKQWPDPTTLTSAGFRNYSYLNQFSEILHLPDGIGDYCSNWIIMNNMTRKSDRPEKFFPKLYRAVLCKPVDGKCREVKTCSLSFDKITRPIADYVPLPTNDLKFEKDGTTIEYEPDVETDSKTERGTYLKEKHAALFNLPTKTEKKLWLCSIPVRISSTGAEPAKPNDTIACLANEKPEGKFDCPGVKACYEKQIDSHVATMAAISSAGDSSLALLKPHVASGRSSSLETHSEAAH
jgi:hypothetical protein